MLNSWTGMGRFTKDPELRTTQNGNLVVTFTIAVDRDHERDKTDFVSCKAWKATAEFIEKNFHKGQLAVVAGAWQSNTWKDKDGKNRISWEVNVSSIYFAEKKSEVNKVDVYVEVDEEGLPF